LTPALKGQDAVVSAVAIPGIPQQKEMMDAAEAAGVRRFILSDFGYGPNHKRLPEIGEWIAKPRNDVLEYAKNKAAANGNFTWSAIAIGNPIDWALVKFPIFGFDVKNRKAIIYDEGKERFTATTMRGIGNAVVGVLKHEEQTKNRHLVVRSMETCQAEILTAFEKATGAKWEVTKDSAKALIDRGREKMNNGSGGYMLDLVVGQLLEEGVGRSVLTDGQDNKLLEMPEESVEEMAVEIVKSVA
jgi:hypothetical protein